MSQDTTPKLYAVVQFHKSKECSEIPTTWLFNDSSMCYWPNTKNISNLINKRTKPDKASWTLHQVTVLKLTGIKYNSILNYIIIFTRLLIMLFAFR